MREEQSGHQVEVVGKELRSQMDWIDTSFTDSCACSTRDAPGRRCASREASRSAITLRSVPLTSRPA